MAKGLITEQKGNIGVVDLISDQYVIWINLRKQDRLHKSRIYINKRDELPYFIAENKRIYLDDLENSWEYYTIKSKKKRKK